MNDLDNNSLKRVDEKHPLDLYIGVDELSRPTLFLISDSEPPVVSSSQIINVSIGRRKDNKWGISFTLLDIKFEDQFSSFCKDIIESSRSLKEKAKGASFICKRYEKWKFMLSKLNGDLLSYPEIKGIIGELYFLKNFLIPKYGQPSALNSWIGPERADQDFVCEDKWYEIKAVESGAESVMISSVEQLDSQQSGLLTIVYLDKTSPEDTSKITLNSIFQEIYGMLEKEELKNIFSGKLLSFGYYPRHEYDEPSFKFSNMEKYIVDSKFPCIRRNILPESILHLQYNLSISIINNTVEKM